MPEFPIKESDISELASRMIGGLQLHGADFPDINWIWLDIKYQAYKIREALWRKAYAHLRLATDAKNTSLDTLINLMKACLKKSAVDVAGNPDKLQYIGWGPKAPPTPADPPGQPRNLEALNQGLSSVTLDWKAPAHDSGGAVRTYVIEQRHQPQGGGDFSNWQPVGTALETEASLTGQPRGPQLEYRIKAINTGGESSPSNTIAVVL